MTAEEIFHALRFQKMIAEAFARQISFRKMMTEAFGHHFLFLKTAAEAFGQRIWFTATMAERFVRHLLEQKTASMKTQNRQDLRISVQHREMSPHPSNTGDQEQPPSSGPAKPKLLEQVRTVLRVNHYSLRTEEACVNWIRRFILFHGKRHPAEPKRSEDSLA